MTDISIAYIRRCIANGLSDDEIADGLAEAERGDRDHEMAYGVDDFDDGLTDSQRSYNDRLDMGRNDAGEWRGFM